MGAAIKRQEVTTQDQNLDMNHYNNIRIEWIQKDMITKFIDIFSAPKMFDVQCTVISNKQEKEKKATWQNFVDVMQNYNKLTKNLTLKNYQFCSITKGISESFVVFCNKVEKETQHCDFKCKSRYCTSKKVTTRYQIIIRTTDDKIREEALKNSWDIKRVKGEEIHTQSVVHGMFELSGESDINKVRRYPMRSSSKLKKNQKKCYSYVRIIDHIKTCKTKKAEM